jgi:hypothetical protein
MFKFFRRKPVTVDPMERLKAAVDEVNAAAALLPAEQRHIRPWVQLATACVAQSRA